MRAWVRRASLRLAELLRKRSRDDEFEAELAAHIELATLDNIDRGMPPEEARRHALISLGGIESTKEGYRDSRGLPVIENLIRDLKLALRTLRRDLGLTLFAMLVVGLGVGASTVVFSVASALLLRPLPFEDPSRLVWVANGTSSNLSSQTVQVGNLLDLRERTQALSDVAGFYAFYGAGDIHLTGTDQPRRLTGVPVTGNFFRLLGISPFLGRDFSDEESRGDASSVILSHNLWRREFDSRESVIGAHVLLDGEATTIIGVLPASFDFGAIFTPGKRADLFTAYPLSAENDRQGNTLALVGRLVAGVDLQTARTEASALATEIASLNHLRNRNDFVPRLRTLRDRVSGDTRHALLILSVAVGLLMLVVCANLSNMLLVRAQGRQREMALHMALGAGRRRLVHRLLIESILLAGGGAVLGLVLATGGTALLANLEGTNIPLLHDVRVDATALRFALLLTMVTGTLFGLAPAFQASATAPIRALRDGGRGTTDGRGSAWARHSLIVAEIALTCVLLTTVGLLTRSLITVLRVDLGFDKENVLALRVDPQGLDAARKRVYFDTLIQRVRAVPGVETLGLTDALPFGDNFGWRTWDARSGGEDESVYPLVRMVDEGYRSTLRLSLRAGRFFTSGDNDQTERVTVVNNVLAERLWPGGDALDQMLTTSGRTYRVVGVVGEARYFGLERPSGPELYLPIRQLSSFNSVDLVIRTTGPPRALVPALRNTLHNVDPNLPTTDFRTLHQLVDDSTFSRRSMVTLLSGFAGFSLLLVSLGVYGVISASVSQRRQEMGVRMALGATPGELQRDAMMKTARPALVGLLIGTAASIGVAQALRGLLVGVGTADPLTYAAVLGVIAACTAVASYVPARRASRVDIVDVLRAD